MRYFVLDRATKDKSLDISTTKNGFIKRICQIINQALIKLLDAQGQRVSQRKDKQLV
jgi:hypothetical protein